MLEDNLRLKINERREEKEGTRRKTRERKRRERKKGRRGRKKGREEGGRKEEKREEERKEKREVGTLVGRYSEDEHRGNSILEGILPPLRPLLQWPHHTNEQQSKPVGFVHVCIKCEGVCVHSTYKPLCT